MLHKCMELLLLIFLAYTPFILKRNVSWFVLSQTALSLTKFIEKSNNILNIK
jgi:hypothetical protein